MAMVITTRSVWLPSFSAAVFPFFELGAIRVESHF